jgi:hypothetical protein
VPGAEAAEPGAAPAVLLDSRPEAGSQPEAGAGAAAASVSVPEAAAAAALRRRTLLSEPVQVEVTFVVALDSGGVDAAAPAAAPGGAPAAAPGGAPGAGGMTYGALRPDAGAGVAGPG